MKIHQTSLFIATAGLALGVISPAMPGGGAPEKGPATHVLHRATSPLQHTSKHGAVGNTGASTSLAAWATRPSRNGSSYAAHVDNLERWNHFPLTVAFAHDLNYTPAREAVISAGFHQWVSATGSLVGYKLVAANAHPDVIVQCDPSRVISQTDTDYNPDTHVLSHAIITMGLSAPDEPSGKVCSEDLRGLAAHEFGHALGINGHSDSSWDLMYPSLGDNNHQVTTRDLNTLRIAYRPVTTTLSQ